MATPKLGFITSGGAPTRRAPCTPSPYRAVADVSAGAMSAAYLAAHRRLPPRRMNCAASGSDEHPLAAHAGFAPGRCATSGTGPPTQPVPADS